MSTIRARETLGVEVRRLLAQAQSWPRSGPGICTQVLRRSATRAISGGKFRVCLAKSVREDWDPGPAATVAGG